MHKTLRTETKYKKKYKKKQKTKQKTPKRTIAEKQNKKLKK